MCVMAARYTAEMVRQMLDDGEAVMLLDSESDISDDEDQDYCPGGSGSRPPGNPTEQDKSDPEESSSVSSEEESVQIMSNRMSWKGCYWSELPPTQGRTQSHNILRSRSGPAQGLSTTVSPKDAWELFISDDIIQEVMKCTNLEGRRVATGSEKNWDVSVRELFWSPLHNPMYKATMSVGRFEDIRRTLRFDDKRTRAFRLETDHMAAFRYVWDLFLVNCRH
ncbi:uncharacterized protein LOC133960645 [Platichthys flesus]|uniref:uncharacterized protein LOC133960645 n=1 Tax=Platichthys flesus TaxID=8260 RepID=UPI002DBCFD69|nr:uncharacterized protein LOC133960645 [Platichthys flesus]